MLEGDWSFRIHVCRFSYHLGAVPLSPVSLSDSRNDAKTSQLELRRAWSGKGPSSRSSFFGSVFTIVASNYLGWSLEQATILVTFHVLKHLSRYVHLNCYLRITHLKRESPLTLRTERRSTHRETLDRLVEKAWNEKFSVQSSVSTKYDEYCRSLWEWCLLEKEI